MRQLLPAILAVLVLLLASVANTRATEFPLETVHVFCGVGDHHANDKVEPVDSAETVESMFEWMRRTYNVKRIYWRTGHTAIWTGQFHMGPYGLTAPEWVEWHSRLMEERDLNRVARTSADVYGMELFLYTGLFEFGMQPEVGAISQYQLEDKLRIEHPEWCMLDRWGERRAPGPISYTYPEARKAVIDRLLAYMDEVGYDGINFYTYVENMGLRYRQEFGFEQAVLDEFAKKYPDIDLRKQSSTLTEEQRAYWYKCRGLFVTRFLRELKAELRKRDKPLSIILDAVNPDYPQPWWSKPIRGTGMIEMDYDTWIREGIVDEIWVQLADSKIQRKTLDMLLEKYGDADVKFTVRAWKPKDPGWLPYAEKGVTPIAVITWASNGIERLTLKPITLASLGSKDWMERAQALRDVAAGKLKVDYDEIAHLATDDEVLVRRSFYQALARLAVDDPSLLSKMKAGITDPQSSVVIAAARALGKVKRRETAELLLQSLKPESNSQLRQVVTEELIGLGETAYAHLVRDLSHENPQVRKVCLRALYKLALSRKDGESSMIYSLLRKIAMDRDEQERVRFFAVDRLTGMRLKIIKPQGIKLFRTFIDLAREDPHPLVQIHAAASLQHLSRLSYLTRDDRVEAIETLTRLFAEFGDESTRSDRAWAWRPVGNGLYALGGSPQSMAWRALDEMRTQTDDAWLAWNSYRTVYIRQYRTTENKGYVLVDEAQAIGEHETYAPAFPGWRTDW